MAKKDVDGLLGTKTADYRPPIVSLPSWGGALGWGGFNLNVVDEMQRDEHVQMCLDYRTSPLYQAKFKLACRDKHARAFIARTLKRFWHRSLGTALGCFPYGYSGSEALYRWDGRRGLLEFDQLRFLHALDVRPWVMDGKLQDVMVQRAKRDGMNAGGGQSAAEQSVNEWNAKGALPLRAATKDRPAKGAWFVHRPEVSPFYGRSVLLTSWWPWRVKTMPDGAREIVFKWLYKHSFSGTVIYAPEQNYQDTPGGPEVTAKDAARQLVEQAKAGADIVLDAAMDEHGNRLWKLEQWAKIEGDASGLIELHEYYNKMIQRGVGIPDEVITFEDTGAYARAAVAVASFFVRCQQDLYAVLEAFQDQILRPLCRLNYGHAEYEIEPEPLLPPDQEQGGQGGGKGGGVSGTVAGASGKGGAAPGNDMGLMPAGLPRPGRNGQGAKHQPAEMSRGAVAGDARRRPRGGTFRDRLRAELRPALAG